MTDFRQYLCWDPTVASRTIRTEAVAPSSSVFFATHTPLTIFRGQADGRKSNHPGTPVDEEEVLHDFLTRPTANGVLLMPIIGESGTGKSHLVRWMREKIPSTDRRHVIYLEKARTSLKTVVDRLLSDVDGEDIAQLRQDVARMGAELDHAGLERRLINMLSEAVAAAEPFGNARVLAGPSRLAAVLDDPHVREHLLRPGKLIPSLAANLLNDSQNGGIDRPLEFTVDDLPLDVEDLGHASEKARSLLRMFFANTKLQVAAVDMLNEHLPVAVTNAGNIGAGRLHRAILEIRREFARQNKELVLLIEDFALIQGVQRDLLDALLEVGERDGRTELAPVRTMMAVTAGYYTTRLADTVRTRIRAATPYVYDLDVQFDPNDDGPTGITAFVGRYLNAARLGHEELDAAGITSADQTPSFCDRCDFRADCHAAFGVSADGHGLYPFNKPALRRAIRARLINPEAFNPRTVVGEVVRTVLVDHGPSLEQGTFPDERFRQEYPCAETDTPLPSGVHNAIEEADALDVSRRATFLELWGDAPPEPTNLSPVLHQAFGINVLDTDGFDSEPTVQPQPEQHHQRAPVDEPAGLSASTVKMIASVEQWAARGKALDTTTAQTLRSMIRDAVVQRYQWTDPLMPQPTSTELQKAWPPNSRVVSIEGAAAEGLARIADPPIRFKRTPANSVFFQALLRARDGSMAGSGAALRRLHQIATQHEHALKDTVVRRLGTSDSELVLALRASLLGATLAGAALPGMDDASLLEAALNDGQAWHRGDASIRTERWVRLWESHRMSRPGLVRHIRAGFGISRGVSGEVRMVDAARAIPLLKEAQSTWVWATPDGALPDPVKRAVDGFTTLNTILEEQVSLLRDRTEQIRHLHPRSTRATEVLRAVDDALTEAIPVGHGPQDHGELRAAINAAQSWDWSCLSQAEQDLDKALADDPAPEPTRAVIIAAARDRGADIARIHEFLNTADQWLTSELQAAQMRQGGAGAGAANRVREVLRRWATIVGDELP